MYYDLSVSTLLHYKVCWMSTDSFVVDVAADLFISSSVKYTNCAGVYSNSRFLWWNSLSFFFFKLLALYSERVCEDVCLFFVFGLSVSFLVWFLHRSPVPDHIVLSRTSVSGPNNTGSFLVYRIISCLGSNSVSHHSVRYGRLEIHPVIKDRVKVEGASKDNLIL